MNSAGNAGIGAGSSLIIAGGSSALTVVGAPEGAAAAATGAIVIGGSTLLKAGGAAIAFSTAKNAASGYNHGYSLQSGNPDKTTIPSKTIWTSKGKDGGHIDVELPGTRPGQIHYQNGRNTEKYLYKDGRFQKMNPKTGQYDVAPRYVNDLLSRPDVQKAIRKWEEYIEQ